MMELATNTITADSKMGSHKAVSGVMAEKDGIVMRRKQGFLTVGFANGSCDSSLDDAVDLEGNRDSSLRFGINSNPTKPWQLERL